MKKSMFIIGLLIITLSPFLSCKESNRCSGEEECSACTDCSRCENCNEDGGKCGVCI